MSEFTAGSLRGLRLQAGLTQTELGRLKMKMSESAAALFNDVLVAKIIEAAEFFSRTKYYPGDFSTAVEILGALLKAKRRELIGGCDVRMPKLKRKYKVRLPVAKRKWPKKR